MISLDPSDALCPKCDIINNELCPNMCTGIIPQHPYFVQEGQGL